MITSKMTFLKLAAIAILMPAFTFAWTTTFHAQPASQYAVNAVDLEIVPDQLDAFIAAIKENADATIQEPGSRQYDVFQSTTNPNQISIYEVYANNQAVQAHRASEHFKKYQADTGKMVAKRQSRPMITIVRNIKPN